MKIAIRDASLEPKSPEDLKEKMELVDVNIFELYIKKDITTAWGENVLFPDKQEELAVMLSKLKLKICAGLVESHLANKDCEPEIDYVVKASQVLLGLGVKILRIDVTSNEPDNAKDWQEYLPIAVKVVNECLLRTEKLGVEFAVENHGTITNKIEFLRALLKEVNSPRLGLTLDTANFYWYGYPLSEVYNIFEEFAPYVKHVHIKNINYPESEQEKTRQIGWEYGKYMSLLSQGNINMEKVVKILKKAKFKNALCIENESVNSKPIENRIEILKNDVEFLKQI